MENLNIIANSIGLKIDQCSPGGFALVNEAETSGIFRDTLKEIAIELANEIGFKTI